MPWQKPKVRTLMMISTLVTSWKSLILMVVKFTGKKILTEASGV